MMTVTSASPRTLAAEPKVRLPFLPQDTMISQPEEIFVPTREVGTQLRGPRFRTVDSQPIAKADAQGNCSAEVGSAQFDQINAHTTVVGTRDVPLSIDIEAEFAALSSIESIAAKVVTNEGVGLLILDSTVGSRVAATAGGGEKCQSADHCGHPFLILHHCSPLKI
jgi:hypothetical protein